MRFSQEEIIILDSTDSTNNYAMRLIRKGEAKNGTAVFTLEQKEGKGRLGRTWISEPSANIILSVISDMKGVSLKNQFIISMVAALAAADILEAKSNSKVFVKWPNDIFINDKKAGGILIENTISGQNWQWAVTGFGININQKTFGEGYNATSLAKETNRQYNVQELATELKNSFLSGLERWKAGFSEDIVQAYNNRLFMKDQIARLEAGNNTFHARIIGVTPNGELITQDTSKRKWRMNEVRIRL